MEINFFVLGFIVEPEICLNLDSNLFEFANHSFKLV